MIRIWTDDDLQLDKVVLLLAVLVLVAGIRDAGHLAGARGAKTAMDSATTGGGGKVHMRIIYEHDFDCPLGYNGLRAYAEARDALAATPPEARTTAEDRAALAIAEAELEAKQKCNCGLEDAAKTPAGGNANVPRCRFCADKAKFIIHGTQVCFNHRDWAGKEAR